MPTPISKLRRHQRGTEKLVGEHQSGNKGTLLGQLQQTSRANGMIAIVLAATLFGAAGAIARLLVGERLTAGNIAGIAIIIAAVTIASFVEGRGKTVAGEATKGRSQ